MGLVALPTPPQPGKLGPVMDRSTGPCPVSCRTLDCMKEETQLRTESLKGTPESAAKSLAEWG